MKIYIEIKKHIYKSHVHTYPNTSPLLGCRIHNVTKWILQIIHDFPLVTDGCYSSSWKFKKDTQTQDQQRKKYQQDMLKNQISAGQISNLNYTDYVSSVFFFFCCCCLVAADVTFPNVYFICIAQEKELIETLLWKTLLQIWIKRKDKADEGKGYFIHTWILGLKDKIWGGWRKLVKTLSGFYLYYSFPSCQRNPFFIFFHIPHDF